MDRENAEAILDKIFAQKGADLDAGTGNLMGALAQNGQMPSISSNAGAIMGDGKSPVEYLKDAANYVSLFRNGVLPGAAVQKELDAFLAAKQADARFSTGAKDCADGHCGTIRNNIASIQARVKELLTNGK